MGHLAEGAASRGAEAVAGVAERHERGYLDVRREPEERPEIALEGPVQGGERGAEAEGAGGEQQVLDRGEDRRVGCRRRAQANASLTSMTAMASGPSPEREKARAVAGMADRIRSVGAHAPVATVWMRASGAMPRRCASAFDMSRHTAAPSA